MANFISIYSVSGNIESKESISYNESIKWIQEHGEYKTITPISIVDLSTKEMVWYSEFIGIDTCIYHTQKFINNL